MIIIAWLHENFRDRYFHLPARANGAAPWHVQLCIAESNVSKQVLTFLRFTQIYSVQSKTIVRRSTAHLFGLSR